VILWISTVTSGAGGFIPFTSGKGTIHSPERNSVILTDLLDRILREDTVSQKPCKQKQDTLQWNDMESL
jgi:hypothetical protein